LEEAGSGGEESSGEFKKGEIIETFAAPAKSRTSMKAWSGGTKIKSPMVQDAKLNIHGNTAFAWPGMRVAGEDFHRLQSGSLQCLSSSGFGSD